MKSFLKLVVFFVLTFFFSLTFARSSFAQENTLANEGISWTINGQDPRSAYVDGNVRSVKIKFTGLTAGEKVYLFPKNNWEDAPFEKLHEVTLDSDTFEIEVCGAGTDALKGKPIGNKNCDANKDYFHEGRIYSLTLFDDEGGQAPIATAAFYVYHSAPIVKIEQATKEGNLGPSIRVSLSGRRPGSDKDNNYEVVVGKNGGISNSQCLTAKKSNTKTISMLPKDHQTNFNPPTPPITEGSPANKVFGTQNNTHGLSTGEYRVKISEQVDEGGIVGTTIGDGCNGGFVYVEIPLTVKSDSIVIGNPTFDPENIEGGQDIGEFAIPEIPCVKNSTEIEGSCDTVETAIGNIDTTEKGFINSIFKLILMLAGFGGVIILIYSGYLIMRSQGDKEKIAAARETITSAILGLLFIVFSIVILEIIGIDILQIPGLSR